MSIVHEPPREHYCNPGVEEVDGYVNIIHAQMIPVGAIWECECGNTFVHHGPKYKNTPGMSLWVKESRFARWRRLRKG